jgi:predicted ATPase
MLPFANAHPAAAAAVDGAPAVLAGGATLTFGEFALDIGAQRLTRGGQPVAVAPRVFAVLQHLAGSGGRLVAKGELLDAVWGHRFVSESVLKVAINALRKVLDDDPKSPRYVETVARKGYRFLGGGGAAPAAVAGSAEQDGLPLGNLPAAQAGLAGLIGREADLQRLLQALAQHRLVTLHGPGGVGKTRLALAAAPHALTHAGLHLPDGGWLLRLDAMADAGPLLPGLARLLTLGAGADAGSQALARAVAGLHLLLVLDNAEHLQAAVAALVAALLAAAPGVRILVTSQVPLRLPEEQVLPLTPLACGEPGDPHAADSAALRLLLARVQQQSPQARLGTAALADATAICRALDGLPLALELAAARVPLLGWAGVRERLQARASAQPSLDLLSRGKPGAPDRQRTLQGALEWAHALLTPAEQAVLHLLSVFAGSFTVEAALAVASGAGVDAQAALDHLDSLREHALLVPVDGDGDDGDDGDEGDGRHRWRLFSSVRGFAALALQQRGGSSDALQRLLAWLAGHFQNAEAPYLALPLSVWSNGLQAEADNVRAALRQGLQEPELQRAAVALFAASTLFRVRGGWRAEAARDHAVVAQLLPQLQPPLGALEQAALDLAVANLAIHAQAVPPALGLEAARRSAAVFRTCGDDRREFMALALVCNALMRLHGPLDERRACISRMQALEPAHWTLLQRRQRLWVAICLQADEGDSAGAQAGCVSYMAAGRALGDDNMVWTAGQYLAQLQFAQARDDEATALLGQLVASLRAAGQARALAHVVAQWAAARIGQEATQETLSELRAAAAMMQAEGRLWWMADALPWPAAWQGRWSDAACLQAWADGLMRQRGDQRGRLFGRLRGRFDAWLDQQPQAATYRSLLASEPALDEATALALAFAAAEGA